MKKAVAIVMLSMVLVVGMVSAAFAGGGQVRGDKGEGAVNQVQVQDPPPFQ